MSHTPVGGHPQGWDHKLADRSSLPPASGEEKGKSQTKNVFAQSSHSMSKTSGMAWREETEGSSASSARSSTSPPYMRWARTLHDLLEDAEGVRLFRKFVVEAGGLHVDRLNFYFAVQGLRQETDPHKIRQVVSAIYKFLRKSQLAMPEDLKQYVKQSIKDGSNIERTVFDHMEQEVTRAITESTYQAFLHSEAYVSYVSAATQPLSSPDTSPPPAKETAPATKYETASSALQPIAATSGLATVHEGEELDAMPPVAPARLTIGALLATQTRRLHSDSAPGSFARKRSVYAPHLTYGGFCPTSRQDSERGSVSSGRSGRTDSDAVSVSGSSVDGMSVRGLRESRESRHRSRLHGLDRNTFINKEQDTAMKMIPRTQRIQSEQLRVLPPEEFAPLLIEKLERVRRAQETNERLERRLNEGEGDEAPVLALPPQLVAAAIREKLQLEDDNDQDILDQHVSRVWSEHTPSGSPPGGRRGRARRRAPPSTLSADSGHYDAGADHPPHLHLTHRRSMSKKTVTELTDSGVSVVGEGTSGGLEPRIMQWIVDGTERMERRREYISSRASSTDRDDVKRKQATASAQRNRTTGTGSKSSGSTASSDAPCTVVVVTFLDENVPYRIKVPASPLTLKTFKEYLPRKGSYRYFFKTECADLDNTVIQEEVSNDNDVLPMFEGKVMARVKSIE